MLAGRCLMFAMPPYPSTEFTYLESNMGKKSEQLERVGMLSYSRSSRVAPPAFLRSKLPS